MTHAPLPLTGRAVTTVRDRLMETDAAFSNSELKVVRQLLANYPAAGLTTVSKLAKAADVSDPTVLRLAIRLGFDGYAELQSALLAEVEAHMRSPLTLAPGPRGASGPNLYRTFLTQTVAQCEAAAVETATADYERVVALLTDPKHRVLCLGGAVQPVCRGYSAALSASVARRHGPAGRLRCRSGG
jgi:DNA-binding MurR/RpiR family transcriptional regulator